MVEMRMNNPMTEVIEDNKSRLGVGPLAAGSETSDYWTETGASARERLASPRPWMAEL